MIVRADDARNATVRLLDVPKRLGNAIGGIHGGALMGFIDSALFAACCALKDASLIGSVTLDCQTQFFARGVTGCPLDARIEVLRETGRLFFMRGQLEQDDGPICAFSSIVRKAR